MDDEPRVLPVIRAIVSMARSLGKRVIAEAIEHVGPVPALMAMGEMDFQGYLLSRPLATADVDELIQTWRSGIVMPAAFRGGPARAEAASRLPDARKVPVPFDREAQDGHPDAFLM